MLANTIARITALLASAVRVSALFVVFGRFRGVITVGKAGCVRVAHPLRYISYTTARC